MSTFDEKAAEWDTPERVERAHALANAVREHVTLEPSMRGVDIGAGTGLLGLDLLADIGSILLTDPSEGMVEVAREKIAANGIADASAAVYDLPADPPLGAPFDLVVSLLALHHVADTEGVLRSVHEMLAPGGQVAMIDLDEEDGSFHDSDVEGIHHHGFDRTALVELAAAVGIADAETHIGAELDRDGRMYPLFLLTGRRS